MILLAAHADCAIHSVINASMGQLMIALSVVKQSPILYCKDQHVCAILQRPSMMRIHIYVLRAIPYVPHAHQP